LLTDGFVALEREAFDLIQNNLSDGNLFVFGIGSSVNRYLIEGIARVGMGEPFIATNEKEAVRVAEKFRKYIQTPVLTDIKVEFQGLQAYDIEPIAIPDMLAERPITVFGKYKGKLQGNIKVTGKTGNGDFENVVNTALASTQNNQAIKYLWARHKIRRLDDYNALQLGWEQVEQILNIGLKYHLLTNYTSFVAIDSVVNRERQVATVKQALPLPQGVSNAAVGAQYGTNIVEISPTAGISSNKAASGSSKRGSEGVRYSLPDETKLYGDSIVLSWDLLDDVSFKEKIEKYEVRIYDLSEELLFKKDTDYKSMTISTSKEKLAGQNNLIIKVVPLDKNGNPLVNVENSEGIAINKLDTANKATHSEKVKAALSAKKEWVEKLLDVAKYFESQKLWTDAMNTYETAVRTLKDRQKLKSEVRYQEFLEKNNLNLK